MSLKADVRQEDDVSIVALHGRITLGEESSFLRNKIDQLISQGSAKILLDVGDVSYIDSAGLGELVSCFISVQNQGGILKLLNLEKRISGILQITKLHTVFEVYSDEAKAVASFRQTASA